jgi:hypothetical protein
METMLDINNQSPHVALGEQGCALSSLKEVDTSERTWCRVSSGPSTK